MSVVATAAAGGAERVAIVVTVALIVVVGLSGAAPLTIVNGTTELLTSAMFSTDQSACYNGSIASASVASITSGGGGATVSPQRQLLVGCLQSCLGIWWCTAARWTPATGECALSSEQLCSDAQTPLRERYLRLDTALPPPPKPLTMNFSDVRSDVRAYSGCQDAQSKGVTVSGIVCIDPDGSGCFPVWCDFPAAGVAYTTIHRRYGAGLDFTNRNWSEYENGFGNLSGEHFLGLRRIAALTTVRKSLIVDLVGKDQKQFSVTYAPFGVDSAATNYTLRVSNWIAGTKELDTLLKYNGRPFSTRDRDNDLLQNGNCATTRGGGWWDDCGQTIVNINGDYSSEKLTCVFWKGKGEVESCNLQYITLRILA